jgi:hypothetical protein
MNDRIKQLTNIERLDETGDAIRHRLRSRACHQDQRHIGAISAQSLDENDIISQHFSIGNHHRWLVTVERINRLLPGSGGGDRVSVPGEKP